MAWALAGSILVAACDRSPAEPEVEAPDTEVVQAFMSALGGSSQAGAWPCPAGGEREVEADAQVTQTETEITVTWSIGIEFRSCAIPLADDTLITDGMLSMAGVERRERFDDVHMGRLLARSSHQTGTLRWRTSDYDSTCALDLTQTFDVGTSETRITGTICGNPVDFTLMLP
jgi:hypothetical protein